MSVLCEDNVSLKYFKVVQGHAIPVQQQMHDLLAITGILVNFKMGIDIVL